MQENPLDPSQYSLPDNPIPGNEYIERISKLNNSSSYLTTTLPYEDSRPDVDDDGAHEKFELTPRNLGKGLTILGCLAVIVMIVVVPLYLNTLPFALAQKNHVSIGTTSNFGKEGNVDAIRANPDVAQNVTLTVRGVNRTFNTTQATVKDILDVENAVIGYGEGVYPALDTPVGDNQLIVIDRITSNAQTQKTLIPKTDQRIDVDSMRKGEETVIDQGVDGEKAETYIIQTVGNFEVSKTLFATEIIKKPQDRITHVGTAEATTNGTIVTVGEDSAKQFALDQIRARGWADEEFNCLDPLWQKESGWRVRAGNIFSGAYGIPQALPGSKMSVYGADWESNAETQIKWGINYIAGRYGTPCGAWSYWQSHHWY